ncbi:transposase [Purpureocillium lilacinum]|uniref:Transposase n=1 Tax=Purpureocillium lilacinum TaxID=33203 RepID=A0A179FJ48_PURLI|nr:transposase [Purpureocillium lilacinum]OAQ65606.1 transposase [Purpureocillium lilacinum]
MTLPYKAAALWPCRTATEASFELWKLIVFAENNKEYEKTWSRLCHEFNDEQALLIYLYKAYLHISAQWVSCYIKKYHNFGVRVPSGTEASNNNVKSYLLNGTSHLYGLVEAIEGMLRDQERDFADKCSQDEVLTARTYSGPPVRSIWENSAWWYRSQDST